MEGREGVGRARAVSASSSHGCRRGQWWSRVLEVPALHSRPPEGGSGSSCRQGLALSVVHWSSGTQLTLGAGLVRLEEREREITAQADATREQIAQLTARLDELGRAAEEVRITRKALLELPDPQPPAGPAPELPDHPAYQQIMARCSPRPRRRYGRGECARRWTWRSHPTTSTTPA